MIRSVFWLLPREMSNSLSLPLLVSFYKEGHRVFYYGTELELGGGPDPDCRRVMPWERVSDSNEMFNFMKKLIQVRKDASGIIQHGTYSLKEIKPDVLALEWNYDGQKVQAIF